jgi:hypothetical protein
VTNDPDVLRPDGTLPYQRLAAVLALAQGSLFGLVPLLFLVRPTKAGDGDVEVALVIGGLVAAAGLALGAFLAPAWWETVVDRRPRVVTRQWGAGGWHRPLPGRSTGPRGSGCGGGPAAGAGPRPRWRSAAAGSARVPCHGAGRSTVRG